MHYAAAGNGGQAGQGDGSPAYRGGHNPADEIKTRVLNAMNGLIGGAKNLTQIIQILKRLMNVLKLTERTNQSRPDRWPH
mgnify:CR=1 FL=1